MPEPIEVCKVPIESVSDAHGLDKLIADGVIEADRVVAVIGKTEGNGGVNDYTRIIADRAFREVLRERGTRPMEEIRQIPSCGPVAPTESFPRTPPSSLPSRRARPWRAANLGCRSDTR